MADQPGEEVEVWHCLFCKKEFHLQPHIGRLCVCCPHCEQTFPAIWGQSQQDAADGISLRLRQKARFQKWRAAAIFATVIIGIILLGALKRWWEG